MSVDFYICNNCNKTFCECGSHSRCDCCGNKLCQGCMEEYAITNYDMEEDCPFCSLQRITDDTLLAFALNKLEMSRDELEDEFRLKHEDDAPEDEEPWAVG